MQIIFGLKIVEWVISSRDFALPGAEDGVIFKETMEPMLTDSQTEFLPSSDPLVWLTICSTFKVGSNLSLLLELAPLEKLDSLRYLIPYSILLGILCWCWKSTPYKPSL